MSKRGPYNRFWMNAPSAKTGLRGWRIYLSLTQGNLAERIADATGRNFTRQDVARAESGDIAAMDGEEWLAVADIMRKEKETQDFRYHESPGPFVLEAVIRNTLKSG